MKLEQFLQSKSKEEIAFILYNGTNYKISCLQCQFYKKDNFGIFKCYSLFENQCRKEFYNWTEVEI